VSPCRCEEFVHPKAVTNPPGLDRIAYRIGTFLEFRHALLLARGSELHLGQWHPGGEGDLAVQLVEWWAYLADVLTFYNERAATEALLRTADDDEAVRNLVRILGYRPRPGLAAHAVAAALSSSKKTVMLPAGFQLEDKPGPGKKPQTFELDAPTAIALPDDVPAELAPHVALFHKKSVLLSGNLTSIARGDELLVVKRDWNGAASQAGVVRVKSVAAEIAPDGTKNTRVHLESKGGIGTGARADQYRLMRSTQSARPRRGTDPSLTDAGVHLDSLYRDVDIGSPLILENGTQRFVVQVTSITESSYDFLTSSGLPPTDPRAAIPVPATFAVFSKTLGGILPASTTVRFGFRDVGELIGTPADDAAAQSIDVTVAPKDLAAFAQARGILIEDADGKGSEAAAISNGVGVTLSGISKSALPLTAPLHLLPNVLRLSRGKTVAREVIGSGDATLPGQDFALRNAPVTYLQDSASHSGQDYSSTIRLRVNGIEWHEVRSFYGQAADARVFVTYEDAEGKTHVKTGDGINGARLPSGVDNVVASYRYGSGQEAPDAGTLTVITKSFPGLRAVRNPVAAGGGADPDPASLLRALAPKSALTFGRAVSAADYEVIAAAAPDVDRVRAYWSFNAGEQRAMLTLYVGDGEAAMHAAAAAIAGAGESDDAQVVLATAQKIAIVAHVVVDPDYDAVAVHDAVVDALADRFSAAHAAIGRAIYRSSVYAACLAVAGVLAVLQLEANRLDNRPRLDPLRYDPGLDGYFVLESTVITTEAPNAG
jgi:hypothetical protein